MHCQIAITTENSKFYSMGVESDMEDRSVDHVFELYMCDDVEIYER